MISSLLFFNVCTLFSSSNAADSKGVWPILQLFCGSKRLWFLAERRLSRRTVFHLPTNKLTLLDHLTTYRFLGHGGARMEERGRRTDFSPNEKNPDSTEEWSKAGSCVGSQFLLAGLQITSCFSFCEMPTNNDRKGLSLCLDMSLSGQGMLLSLLSCLARVNMSQGWFVSASSAFRKYSHPLNFCTFGCTTAWNWNVVNLDFVSLACTQ